MIITLSSADYTKMIVDVMFDGEYDEAVMAKWMGDNYPKYTFIVSEIISAGDFEGWPYSAKCKLKLR